MQDERLQGMQFCPDTLHTRQDWAPRPAVLLVPVVLLRPPPSLRSIALVQRMRRESSKGARLGEHHTRAATGSCVPGAASAVLPRSCQSSLIAALCQAEARLQACSWSCDNKSQVHTCRAPSSSSSQP